MGRIYWLASYPKSGNTWLRIVLANLLADGDTPVSINALAAFPSAGARHLFDAVADTPAAQLSEAEIACRRPRVYAQLATAQPGALFFKIHDAYTLTPAGDPLIPLPATAGVVYVLRNPLDVAVSFAHHNGCALDRMLEWMNDFDYAFRASPPGEVVQLPQRLLTWSAHVLSWTFAPRWPVLVVRYEDMMLAPLETFGAVAHFCGLPPDPVRLVRALGHSDFAELQRQEVTQGFLEKSPRAPAFFRKGRIGAWREELSPAQATRLIADHQRVMTQHGYLTAAGTPVY
jgi:aryl sulfotransferase